MAVDLTSIDITNFISHMNKPPDNDSYKDIKTNGILLIQSILLSGKLVSELLLIFCIKSNALNGFSSYFKILLNL